MDNAAMARGDHLRWSLAIEIIPEDVLGPAMCSADARIRCIACATGYLGQFRQPGPFPPQATCQSCGAHWIVDTERRVITGVGQT